MSHVAIPQDSRLKFLAQTTDALLLQRLCHWALRLVRRRPGRERREEGERGVVVTAVAAELAAAGAAEAEGRRRRVAPARRRRRAEGFRLVVGEVRVGLEGPISWEWNGMEWNGTRHFEWNGMEWNGMNLF